MLRLLLILLIVAAVLFLAWVIYRKYILKVKNIGHLPIRDLGFTHMPALPLSVKDALETALLLLGREKEFTQAKIGLSKTFNIQGFFANAYSFLYGTQVPNDRKQSFLDLHKKIQVTQLAHLYQPQLLAAELKSRSDENQNTNGSLTSLFLEEPEQFAISWTTYANIYRDASAQVLTPWAQSLTNVDAATEQFFPNLAQHGAAFNLLVVKKVALEDLVPYQNLLSTAQLSKINTLKQEGRLYSIDMSIFESLEPQVVNNFDRFTPSTYVWLEQDQATKQLKPFIVYVAANQGNNAQIFSRGEATDGAWLYALQAAKVSLTVYGIWYGHVYHWHITTAAMVMTMYDNIPSTHNLYRFLNPQSTALIGFNDVLLLLWEKIAPPTSIKTAYQFLEMTDTFAKGRLFFEDDPTNTLSHLGITAEDFTQKEAWDQYPIVGLLLQIWDAVGDWVQNFVEHTYQNDQEVRQDHALQNWIKAAGSEDGGNIQGLPFMDGKANLQSLLHSLVYRIVAHGVSRMQNSANPGLSFVPNFPPCLQKREIPEPDVEISTKDLLRYLPNTGSIGEMITFLFTFAFSAPYDSLIPVQGLETGLFFPEGDERNPALIEFRRKMQVIIEEYTLNFSIPGRTSEEAQIHQWPISIET